MQLLKTTLLFATLLATTCTSATNSKTVQENRETNNARREPTEVLLTLDHRTASFPVDATVIATSPAILELSVTKITNPSLISFELIVYLDPDKSTNKQSHHANPANNTNTDNDKNTSRNPTPDSSPNLSLSNNSERGLVNDESRILLGHIGVYPSDAPNKFLLRTSTAFEKLKVTGATSAHVSIELKPLRAPKPGERLDVIIAEPKWRREK